MATVSALIALFVAVPAQAAFTLDLSKAGPSAAPAGTTAANAFTDFEINMAFDDTGDDVKKLEIDMPKGALATLSSATVCPTATYNQKNVDACPASSQVGTVSVKAKATVLFIPIPADVEGKIFRIPAVGTEVARLGIAMKSSLSTDVIHSPTAMTVRDDGTYGIRATTAEDLPTEACELLGLPVVCAPITLGQMNMKMFKRVQGTNKGFFFNAPECGPATTVVKATPYTGSPITKQASYTVTGCEESVFAPTVEFEPNPAGAARPEELAVRTSQQFDATAAAVSAPFKKVTVTMPQGASLTGNSDSDGQLVGCTDAQFNQASQGPSTCPAGADVGSVLMDSPLVGEVHGRIYLAGAAPGHPDNLFQLFFLAEMAPEPGTSSVGAQPLRVKLRANVRVDQSSGRLIAELLDLPAQPVRHFVMKFRAGNAPATRQPRLCGTYDGGAEFISYSHTAPRSDTADWLVNENCGGKDRFNPTVAMSVSPTTAGAFSTAVTTIDIPNGDEPLTGVKASLPPGLLAKLKGVARCSVTAFGAGTCPASTKVGKVDALAGQSPIPGHFKGDIFLTDAPSDDAVAGLGIRVPVVVGPVDLGFMNVQAKIRLRGDYGVDVISAVPETLRKIPLDQRQLKLTFDRAGFMTNPSTCSGNTLASELRSSEGKVRTPSAPIAVTGCEQLAFAPSIAFALDGPAVAGGGAPLVTTLTMPASTDEAPQAPPAKIKVTLPAGVALSPSAGARGDLAGCSDAQFDRGSFADPACPAGSVVGDVSIDTPSVGVLSGKAYLAAGSGDQVARMMLDASSEEFGKNARVKLIGAVHVDPATGATTASFDEIPAVPFTRFTLRLRGGDSPVLALPRACGTHAGGAAMTATNGATANPAASLTVDQGCDESGKFEPSLALSGNPTQAAASTALSAVIGVPSGQQELRSLRIAMPHGLLGKLTASAQCPLDQARAGACGDDSLVGTIQAKAGVRGAPFTVPGKVYMTAGDGGAIAGLMFKLPAKVGPIDLGEVVTLARIELVGNGLQMQIATDDVPTQVKGIPLMLSELAITIDRPGVALNPSHCAPQSASANFTSAQGGAAQAGAGYQATGCEGLRWTPGFSLDASGEVKAKGHPTLTIGITQPDEQGNLRAADVTLPDGVSTDLKNINARVCASEQQAIDGGCPATAKIGTVAIDTPALPGVVGGELLIVRVPGQVLPGLAIHVRDRIAFDLVGRVSINSQGRIRTVFDGTPDTPIRAMTLVIRGGADGVLQLNTDICTPGRVTNATLTAHHGAAVALTPGLRCNGAAFAAQAKNPAQATSTFSLKKGMKLTLSDPNGIKRITIRLPKGAVFHQRAAKRVKVKPLGGVKAKVKITNDRRKLRITLTPRKKGTKVTRLTLTAPASAIQVNKKVKQLMAKSKTSKKKRLAQLTKLMTPTIHLTDMAGKTRKADVKLKVSGIK